MATMMLPEVVVQGLGGLAAAVGLGSFQAARRRRVILLQVVACGLWAVHFTALGAYAGAWFNLLALVRGLLALAAERDGRLRRLVLLFIPAAWGLALATAEGPTDLLLPVALTLTTLAQWASRLVSLRLLMLFSSAPWLAYSLLAGSWGGIANESLNVASSLIGLFRHHARPWWRARRLSISQTA